MAAREFIALVEGTPQLRAPGAGDTYTAPRYAAFTKGLGLPDAGELTIATGAIAATGGFHTIDTETDAASDDLDTITGGVDGMVLVVQAENTARTVVAKDGTGNLKLAGDYSIDDNEKALVLIYSGALSAWVELSRVNAIGEIKPQESLVIAVSDETTALTTGTAKVTFRMPYAFTLSAVRASVTTAPTGATLIADINEGGASILSTKLSIDVSEKTSTTAASAAVISDAALADDAEITIDIDQIGSTIAGAGLKVVLIGNRA